MRTVDIYLKLLENYRTSQKKIFDTENFFYRLYRPVSFPLTAPLIKMGVSANAVTAVGACCLILSIITLASGGLMLGAVLYLVAYILDFVDGNIARYVGKPTYFGKMIDGLVDSLTFLLFVAAARGNSVHELSLFGGRADLIMGVATSFGFLFRSYFQIRLAFVLSQDLGGAEKKNESLTDEGNAIAGTKGLTLNRPPLFMRLGKKVYFGIMSGMPIFLLVAVLMQIVSLFLAGFFLFFVVLTFFEVAYGLRRIYAADKQSARTR